MKLGYNTNGLTGHSAEAAIALLTRFGYRAIAITLDHYLLNPYSQTLREDCARIRGMLLEARLTPVVETGARFLLDPFQKHEPTLLSRDPLERARRLDFLKRAVDIAADIGSEVVSFWSGVLRDDISPEAALDRLAEGCGALIPHAGARGVKLAFEPEPGMLVDTMARFDLLWERVDAPNFGLTIDIGHLQCLEPRPISHYLKQYAPKIYTIHLEDMRCGIHEHLPLGEGEIDFEDVFAGLRAINYQGTINLELSRHSHLGPEMVEKSIAFLRKWIT